MKIKAGIFKNTLGDQILSCLDSHDVVGLHSPGKCLLDEIPSYYNINNSNLAASKGTLIFIRREERLLRITKWSENLDVNNSSVHNHFKGCGESYIGIVLE